MRRLIERSLLALTLTAILICGCSLRGVDQPTGTAVPNPVETTDQTILPVVPPTSTMRPTASISVSPTSTPPIVLRSNQLLSPPAGQYYLGVYPGGRTGEEDDLLPQDLQSFTVTIGKKPAWMFFSNNWYRSRAFPVETADWARTAGSIPYIRLMLRSDPDGEKADPLYSMDRILAGDFDQDLHTWCSSAKQFYTPIIAEFGTEMNGDWFPWNARWNGAGVLDAYGLANVPDGPERFRDAYQRIIDTCREESAVNITWVFHVNATDFPEDKWNEFEWYYPGDEYIDWLAVSVYGAQTPLDDYNDQFSPLMDYAYPRLISMAPGKPIIVAEFGVTAKNPLVDQAEWTRDALTSILADRYPGLIGFSWWNEWWENDDDPNHDTTMRVQDSDALAAVFRELVGENQRVLDSLLIAE